MVFVAWAVFALTIASAILYAVRPEKRWRRLCWVLLGAGFVLSLATSVDMIWSGFASAEPADGATFISAGISEGVNCLAFWLILTVPALVLLGVGKWRHRSKQRSAPP